MNSQLLSAENSSLIQTVNQTDGAAQSVFTYSLDRFTPSHAFQKIRVKPQQTKFRKSQTLTFNLPRIAWLKSAVISGSFGFDAAAMFQNNPAQGNDFAPANPFWSTGGLGFLRCLKRINFESSTRLLYSTTGDAIYALISDLSAEAQLAVAKGFHCTVDPFQNLPAGRDATDEIQNRCNQSADAGHGRLHFSFDLLMCITGSVKLCVPLMFTEASRITVELADSWDFGNVFFAANTAADAGAGQPSATVMGGALYTPSNALTLHDVHLDSTFIQLQKVYEEAVISDNFSSSVLTMLTWNTERLQPVSFPMPNPGEDFQPVTIRLDSTKCVSDIYVFWRVTTRNYKKAYPVVPSGTQGAGDEPRTDEDMREALTALDCALPLEYITLELSGEKVMDEYPAKHLQLYGRRTTSGTHGGWYSTNPPPQGYQLAKHPTLFHTVTIPGAPAPVEANVASSVMGHCAGWNPMSTCYVYKIDMSQLDSNNKTYSSGYTSFRGISVPSITVKPPKQYEFTGAGDTDPRPRNVERIPYVFNDDTLTGELCVVLRTGALTSVSGADGKTVNILSN
jgi:hypothetical protein